MFVFVTTANLAPIDVLLVSIPESLGLLAFGVGLVAVAVIGRWLLARVDDGQDKKERTKEAEVR